MRRAARQTAFYLLHAFLIVVPFTACGGSPDVTKRPSGVGTGGDSAMTGGTGSGATGGTNVINTGGQGTDDGGAGNDDPCAGPNPPSECFNLMPSGPACGDGEINQDSEECDDGNSLPGDGCSGVCAVEMYFRCDKPGKPCTSTIVCGDGKRDPGEVCDDGNTDDDDGCSKDCLSSDASYVCPTPGEPCILLYKCGDGRVNGSETCDDGNAKSGDGCSAKCRNEDGYACGKPGKACTRLVVCGDGIWEGTEQCDDGNNDGEDGCSPQCLIEANFDCTNQAGEKSQCKTTVACGDGVVSGAEACDDGGTDDGDGCKGDCSAIEEGYACARPGHPCQTVCGDGLVRGDEQCDDGHTVDGDGCSSTCTIEDDSVCTVSANAASACQATVCGNGNDATTGSVSTEPCDDQNHDWGDGCTPSCTKEPTCPNGGACTSACGDGIKFPSEACDDGNTTNGDGCSSTCTIEEGYSCTTAGGSPDLLNLPMIVRDFQRGAPLTQGTPDTGITTGDSDFQWSGISADPDTNIANNWTNYPNASTATPGAGDAFTGGRNGSVVAQGLTFGGGGGMEYGFVQSLLSAQKKPLFMWADSEVGKTGSLCPLGFGALIRDANGQGGAFCVRQVQNATSFARWYTDVDAYNNTYERSLPLHRCTGSEPTTGDACSNQIAGTYVYDSNFNRSDGTAYGTPGIGYKGFWPVDDAPGVAKYGQCNLSCTIDANCPSGSTCTAAGNTQCSGAPPTHNFSFTSEVHHWFQYDNTNTAALPKLIFRGDDDVWVFIGGKLVLDLGGTHPAAQGIVALRADGDADVTRPVKTNLNATETFTVSLGLTNNSIYDIVVFQAERNTCESNYRLTLQNFNLRKSTCTPICGKNPDDTVTVTPPEECDDGDANTSSPEYGKCTAGSCTLGPYCGDNLTDSQEDCDSNGNRAVWGQSGCAPGCKTPPSCGDGNIDTPFEECDLGSGNTTDGYNGCTKQCKIGPSCGDGVVNGDEVCDDGVNDNTYESCAKDCSGFGPRCGDGHVDDTWGEECDDPNDPNCSNCKLGAQCGDGITQDGEDCDDGTNDGGYGECGPECMLGPHCGDGVVQSEYEQCDDGENKGGYGKCKAGCKYDAHCGDGKVDKPYEECDDKNNKNGDGCSSACKNETKIR